MLADLGAEVIKIEMPRVGDEARHFGPYQEDESTYFMMLNRSKKSVTVDMKDPRGQDIVRGLVPVCDVIVENFRPGVMDRLGLGVEVVRALNPNIIYASISGFGQDSPLKNWPAFDLVIQAMSGLMSLTGPKGGPATAVGESIADVCTGMFAAFGIVSALFERERSGKAGSIDVAMLDSMLAMQLTGLSRQLYSGDTPKPVGNRHPVTYPVDSFSTRDGDIVMVCFSQAAFAALAELMEQPELADDPRFKTNDARNQNEDELRNLIANWVASQERDRLVETLQSAGIPAGPVWSLEDVTHSDHAASRALVTSGRHTKFGDVPLVPQPVKFDGISHDGGGFVPTLGEHTEEVLHSLLALDEAETEELKEAGII